MNEYTFWFAEMIVAQVGGYCKDKSCPREEIPCKDEIKKPAELAAPLPANNKDFNSLAFELAKALPRLVGRLGRNED